MTPRIRNVALVSLALAAWIALSVRADSGSRADACVPAGQWAAPGAGAASPEPAAQALARLARQQVVLLGENHENPEHHRWQLHTIAALHALQPHMVLGFEMFPRRVQPVLDRWVAGELTEEAFLAQAEWPKVWGYEPAFYLPLFQFARMNRVPMIGLNVERGLVRRVGDEGWAAIPSAEREGVSDPAPPARDYLLRLHESFRDHHPGGPRSAGDRPAPSDAELAEPRFRRFVEGQQVWDRAMAERLAERLRGPDPPLAVGIMGSGHLREGHGVPHQLRDLGVKSVATALPWEASLPCAGLRPGLTDALYGVEPRPAQELPRPRLGIAVEPGPGGVRIREVTAGSVAEQSGLRAGDVITRAAGAAVREPGDVIAIVRAQPAGTILPLTVQRGDQTTEILARFPAAP